MRRTPNAKKVKAGVKENHFRLEFMDTTLRDGEQTQGVALTSEEKLTLAHVLIEKIGVDRIEVASARVSKGEGKSLRKITAWARKTGVLERIEVLGFCDLNKSADWIREGGGNVMNLLVKGSLKHLQNQLKKTPSQHVDDITKTVEYCAKVGIRCNCYLEDWSNGMQEKEN
ncbi:MAG: hypothetical protein JNK54_10805, partial [Elusimicrobia bacterium]|nr:hypothetical protein [Elusimicrobiota bacterium]